MNGVRVLLTTEHHLQSCRKKQPDVQQPKCLSTEACIKCNVLRGMLNPQYDLCGTVT